MESLVLDTSTLILLAKIDLLEPLGKKMALLLPEGVAEEATKKSDSPDAVALQHFIKEGLLRVERKKEDSLVRTLEQDFQLGRGEAEALALAKRKGLPLGVDDGLAIKACKALGIRFVTSLGFLVRFYEKGEIQQEEALARVERLKKYGWYHSGLIAEAVSQIKGGEGV